ncbi:MAG TPA: DUF1697 domain-containing protein [Clostridiales bacterium]|nr:DUF1697 domain-containing protein [Clostridiales bacterium]
MKYAVLFKGINVGGKNVVKMKDLKQLFLELGMDRAETYIQSGNAVVETALEETALREMVQTGFAGRFGFERDVFIRSEDEIRALIGRLPFSEEEIAAAEAADPQVEHLYVYFLGNPPEQSQLEGIYKGYIGPDMLRAGERELYFLSPQSIRKSKLVTRIDRPFHSATARNWKTVNKLYEMLSSL